MLKIVNGPADLRGFDREQFYNVYRMVDDKKTELVAIASSEEEALDAQEMLCDLSSGLYYISSPKTLAN